METENCSGEFFGRGKTHLWRTCGGSPASTPGVLTNARSLASPSVPVRQRRDCRVNMSHRCIRNHSLVMHNRIKYKSFVHDWIYLLLDHWSMICMQFNCIRCECEQPSMAEKFYYTAQKKARNNLSFTNSSHSIQRC